jgi:uncharacterized membrane protein HdeD (DUF308 family)
MALRGALAIVIGVIALVWPRLTLLSVVWLWGSYALVDGVFAAFAAVRAAGHLQPWLMLLLRGVTGIAAGIIAFVWTRMTAIVLVYLIAAWAIVAGIFEIVATLRLRQVIEGEWLLGLSGALSILLGLLIIVMPGAGLLAWVWMIGVYALVCGVVLLALAFRLRALGAASSQRGTAM